MSSRSIPRYYMGPIGVNAFVALSALLLVARAIGSAENLRSLAGYIDMASEQTQEIGRSALITSPMWLVDARDDRCWLLLLSLIACSAERKERTILFFKSFPGQRHRDGAYRSFAAASLYLPALSLACLRCHADIRPR